MWHDRTDKTSDKQFSSSGPNTVFKLQKQGVEKRMGKNGNRSSAVSLPSLVPLGRYGCVSSCGTVVL